MYLQANMEQPRFRGFCVETNTWQYGHGWFRCDYTEEYKRERGIDDLAILYTVHQPVECHLASMGRFVRAIPFADKAIDIYEHDILVDVTSRDMQIMYVVVWDKYDAGFVFIPLFEAPDGEDNSAITYDELHERHGDNLYPMQTVFDKPDVLAQIH